MDPRVQEILESATDIQQDYIRARLIHPNMARAAKSLGLNRSTPIKWDNLDEIEEAVAILRRDAVEAARLALQDLALEAVQTLKAVLQGKGGAAVRAADSILDRVGIPKQSAVDVTSKGQSVQPITFVEIAPPSDGE